jgi:hypothetical protein
VSFEPAQIASCAYSKGSRTQRYIGLRQSWLAPFAGQTTLAPTWNATPEIISRTFEAVKQLRQMLETVIEQHGSRSVRTIAGTTSNDQRVARSEQRSHDIDKLRIIDESVAIDTLPRYIERTRRPAEGKFEFAPDVDVSIPSL